MSLIEAIATLFGLLNIILIVQRSVWNYPFALAMVSLYALIFWDAKLYSDAGLQVFFFVINVYGWWSWQAKKADAGEIVVERLSSGAIFSWIAGSLAAILGWGALMNHFTDATHPWWDGSVAMLSIVAQVLMTRRYLENWYWWIVVNLISLPLYYVKHLNQTVGLYALFLIVAVWGLLTWKKAEKDAAMKAAGGRA